MWYATCIVMKSLSFATAKAVHATVEYIHMLCYNVQKSMAAFLCEKSALEKVFQKSWSEVSIIYLAVVTTFNVDCG